jgi:hypothetical protein
VVTKKAVQPETAHANLNSEHPNAADMLDSALAAHTREAQAITAETESAQKEIAPVRQARIRAARAHMGSEHPNSASMLDAALAAHYSLPAAASGPQLPVGTDAEGVDPEYAQAGSEHPVAAGMVSAALNSHADAPHNVFGLEH